MKLPNLTAGIIFTLMLIVVMIIYQLTYEGVLNKNWEIVGLIIAILAMAMGWYFFFKNSLPRIIDGIKKIINKK